LEDYSDYIKVLFSTAGKRDPPFAILRKLAQETRTVSLNIIRNVDTL
jgi:hypothetical protein